MSAVQSLNNTNEAQSKPLRARNSITHSQWWISSCDVHQIRWLRGIFPHRNERILPHHHPLMYPWPLGPTDVYHMHVFAPVNCQAILNLLWKKMSEKLDSPIRTCIEKHFYSIKWTWIKFLNFCSRDFGKLAGKDSVLIMFACYVSNI